MRNRFNWAISKHCVNACIYCGSRDLFGDAHALPAATVRRIARDVAEAGFREVVFAGGEPLLSPTLGDAIEVLRGRAELALFTGGIPGDLDAALQRIGGGIDRIAFSIDAADAPLNDELRGRKGATDDLFRLAAAVREGLPRVYASFNTVVSRHNVDSLDALWERIRGFRPYAWSLTLVGDFFTASPSGCFLDATQLERFYLEIVPALAARAQAEGVQLVALPVPLSLILAGIPPARWDGSRGFPGLDAEFQRFAAGEYNATFVERFACPLVGMDVAMGAEGEIYPCSQASAIRPEYVVGNAAQEPLEDILRGERIRAFADRIPHPPCHRCWAPSNIPDDVLGALIRDRPADPE